MENEAERPKFDLWLPPVPLWLLSGHPERSSPPLRRNTPSPAPQVPVLPFRIKNAPHPMGGMRGVWYHEKGSYFAALAALIASVSMGVTLNRSPQMP